MANLIRSREGEQKINFFHDLDGDLKKHSSLEIKLHRALVRNTRRDANSKFNDFLRAGSNLFTPFSREKSFEDSITFLKEMSEVAPQYIFSKNLQYSINHFANKNNLDQYLSGKKQTKKTPQDIGDILRSYKSEGCIQVLSGDTLADLEHNYNYGPVARIGYGGPLEHDQDSLRKIPNIIFVEEKDRIYPVKSIFKIYDGLDKEFNRLGVPREHSVVQKVARQRDYYGELKEKLSH